MRRFIIALAVAALGALSALAVTATGQTQNCTGPDYCPIPAQTTPPNLTVLGASGGRLHIPKSARGKGQKCAAKNFTFKATVNTKNPLKFAKVFIDSNLIKTTTSKHVVARVNVHKLRHGLHKLHLRVTDAAGLTASKTAAFTVCAKAATLPSRRPGFTG